MTLSIVRLAERLLDEGSTHEQLTNTCAELYDVFARAGGFDSTDLAAANAAACLLDTNRTVAFVRGLWAAIRDAQRRFPGAVVEVVYAGTGPFASLATPLMPLLSPRDVRFTLIEVNARSITSLETLLETLRLTPHVGRIVHGDATCYRHSTPIHVAVTETMQRALSREPFVAVAQNLKGQLAVGGLLVPQRVAITAAAIDAELEKARWNGATTTVAHRPLARLIEISSSEVCSAPVVVTFPDADGREYWIGLLTEIATFGSERLRCYDSGLTMPDIIWPLSPMIGGETVEFRYRISASPGIEWRRF
ncbi:MAG: hypothetical protein AABO58_19175 [Acidobacteriota bacterium]